MRVVKGALRMALAMQHDTQKKSEQQTSAQCIDDKCEKQQRLQLVVPDIDKVDAEWYACWDFVRHRKQLL